MPHKPKSDQRADEAPRGDPSERRRHLRVPIGSKARVLTPDGNERPCLVVNASAGGALLKAKEPPSPGERVVVYIDEIGRFEGRVVRASRHSFAVDYRSRRGKLQRTADALIEAVNNKGRKPDRRGTPRIRQNQNATVVLDSGETVECTMLDISLTGASIAIDPRPRLGELVTVGKMKAKVVRRHDKGVGVVFLGSAERMEDVIEKTGGGDEATGADVASGFGRKKPSA